MATPVVSVAVGVFGGINPPETPPEPGEIHGAACGGINCAEYHGSLIL